MTPCTLWEGCKLPAGYGRVWFEGKPRLAHRAAYVQHHGMTLADIKGVVVRHSCDNPSCVNPHHLTTGTQADNMQECVERGRGNKRMLTQADAAAIRARHVPGRAGVRSPNSQSSLAREYGVSAGVIYNIVAGKGYKEYKEIT